MHRLRDKISLSVLIVLFFCCIALGQDKNADREEEPQVAPQQSQKEGQPDTIPFTLTPSNNILIKATLNDQEPVTLMFHTAVDSVSLTEEAVKRLKHIVFDQSTNVTSWGGETTARHSSGNTLKIGNLSWRDISITEGKLSGNQSDGKFGPNLFENKVFEINFDKKILVVHETLPEIDSGYEQLKFVAKRRSLVVEAQIQIGKKTIVKNEFMIHSGFGGTVMLDDNFVSAHDLVGKLKTVRESELRDSFGNRLITKHVILPALAFGGHSFDNIPARFFDGQIGNQQVSVVGGEILKRFNMIFDVEHGHLYLKPNTLFNNRFEKSP